MTRQIESTLTTLTSMQPPDRGQNVRTWLESQVAGSTDTFYLLAHADDGVIWGRVEHGTLITAPETDFSPALRLETLQSARLFNQIGEVLLWRDGEGVLCARTIVEGGGNSTEYFDENQILWGNQLEVHDEIFTQVSDGVQGFRHIVPLTGFRAEGKRPLRLTIRHYLAEDNCGFVRVAYSRLVRLLAE